MVKIITLILCAFLSFLPAFASQAANGVSGNPVDFFSLLENGGQSLAFLVAMYWLKDSHQRRIEEAKEFATQIKDLKTGHKEEIHRMYESHTKDIMHCQDEVGRMTEKLWEWIKEHKDA